MEEMASKYEGWMQRYLTRFIPLNWELGIKKGKQGSTLRNVVNSLGHGYILQQLTQRYTILIMKANEMHYFSNLFD
jgi:hypothetical protein